jgi:translation initiation factor 2B subunit (eIF-2B alpha/beta/delta family)
MWALVRGARARGGLAARVGSHSLPPFTRTPPRARQRATQAGLLPFVKDCLRPGESVVTAGGCPSLSAFLERAAARSSAEEPLRVLWVQGGAPGSGAPAAARDAAAHLAARAPAKARVALVPEACAWGALGAGAGVTKCLLPAALIARDGSALVGAGGLALALEAAARGIPVLLVASAARLSPAGSAREALAGAAHPQAPPTGVLPLAEAGAVGACGALAVASAASQGSAGGGGGGGGGGAPSVTVLNALFDVLEAPLVGLVVTSAGVAAPGGAWRLCSEAYGSGAA